MRRAGLRPAPTKICAMQSRALRTLSRRAPRKKPPLKREVAFAEQMTEGFSSLDRRNPQSPPAGGDSPLFKGAWTAGPLRKAPFVKGGKARSARGDSAAARGRPYTSLPSPRTIPPAKQRRPGDGANRGRSFLWQATTRRTISSTSGRPGIRCSARNSIRTTRKSTPRWRGWRRKTRNWRWQSQAKATVISIPRVILARGKWVPTTPAPYLSRLNQSFFRASNGCRLLDRGILWKP